MNPEATITGRQPRPSRHDERVITHAGEKLLPKVAEWLRSNGDEASDDVLPEILSAIKWDDDGYNIASKLDSCGWMPDAGLVEILDEVGHLKRRAHDALQAEWVTALGLEGPPVDSKVIYPGKPDAGIGTVTANSPQGYSTVRFPALGHVAPEQIRGGSGTTGLYVAWELLSPAP